MNDSPDSHNSAPPSPGEALLLASLDRPLTADERARLAEALAASPELAQEHSIVRLLGELRCEARIARHEAQAWQQFRTLAEARSGRAAGLQRWFAALRPALPALAMLLIVVQAGSIAWLTQRPEAAPAMRGGTAAACPALEVRLKADTRIGELSRLLLQADAQIAAGPDAAGRFRLTGPAAFLRDAPALLGPLAESVQPAADCGAP